MRMEDIGNLKPAARQIFPEGVVGIYLEKKLEERGISVYRFAKNVGIPYTTALELVRGKKAVEKAASHTVYKMAKVLGVTMEELVEAALIDSEEAEQRKAESEEK